MKLLFCPDCGDVTQIVRDYRYCRCKAVKARYLDDENVELIGERAQAIGIDSNELHGALILNHHDTRGAEISAWLFSPSYSRIRRMGRQR